jgi:hypothetical protein
VLVVVLLESELDLFAVSLAAIGLVAVSLVAVSLGVIEVGVLLGVDVHWVVPQAVDELLRGDFAQADLVDSGEQGELILLEN